MRTIRVRSTEKGNESIHTETSQTDALKASPDETQHLEPADVGVGISTESETLQASAPLNSPRKRAELELEQEEEQNRVEDIGHKHDSTCQPVEPEPKLSDWNSALKAPSYLVSENCLLELFEACPACRRGADVKTRRLGAFLSVEQQCRHCRFSRRWSSQPLLENSATNGFQLSAAVYVTTSSFLKLEKIFQIMQLKMFHDETFQRNSRLYIEPEIEHQWKTAEDQQQSPVLGGDSRDVQQLLVIKVDPPCSSSLDPEALQIKEEDSELRTGREGEQLRRREEFSIPDVPVKSEDDEEAQSSQLRAATTEDSRETEPPACTSDPCSSSQPNTDPKVFEMDVSIDGDDDDDVWQKPWSDSEHDNGDAGSNPCGRKAFGCNVCTKTFPRLQDLKSHVSTHTGEKPFDCDMCGKTFVCQSSLQSHREVHIRQRPFSCSICGKRYKTQSLVNRHAKVHVVSCKVCAKTFSLERNLKLHMIAHKAKPFGCKICGRKFRQKQRLQMHQRLHLP